MAETTKARTGSGPLAGILVVAVLAQGLLLPATLRAARPGEPGEFRPPDLVEVVRLDSSVHLDIRYATKNNFMHRPMYAGARLFLQRPAAESLLRVHRKLRVQGLGLLLFDGYRPWSVTKEFWDATPRAQRKFVANPSRGSRHNRGCAVDCSLYDRASGQEIPMPSAYDEFSGRASPRYEGGTEEQRRMRDLLRRAMEEGGFSVDPNEWWHFDYRDWRLYRIMNVPFDSIH